MSLTTRILVAAVIVAGLAPEQTTGAAVPEAKKLVLEKAGAERTLPERMLGASAEALIEHLLDDPQKVAALKDMHLALVRFPGGTYSNYYNWRSGVLDIEATPRSAPYKRFWARIAPKIRVAFPHGVSIEDYTKFAREAGAEVLLVPNLETSSVTDQVAWFRRMKDEGIVPHYIELGNEFWIATGMDEDVLKRWPDAPTSMRVMKEYCDALRPYFPLGGKVAVQAAGAQYWPTGSPTGDGGARLRQWDADLKPADWFDAVTIHPYPRIDQIMGVAGATKGWREPQQAMKLFRALLAHCDQGIDNVVEDVRQRMPGKEIWVTEWSTRATDFRGVDQPSPAMHIQLVSRMTFALLRHREVKMSLFYTLNFMQRGVYHIFQPDGEGGYQPMPHLVAMRWFNEAANGGATYQRLLEAGARAVPGGGPLNEGYLEVEAGLFQKTTGTTLIVQNCSAEPRLINLAELPGSKTPQQIETLATPDLSQPPVSETLASLQPDANGVVRLPPYSLTRMMWK